MSDDLFGRPLSQDEQLHADMLEHFAAGGEVRGIGDNDRRVLVQFEKAFNERPEDSGPLTPTCGHPTAVGFPMMWSPKTPQVFLCSGCAPAMSDEDVCDDCGFRMASAWHEIPIGDLVIRIRLCDSCADNA